MQVLDVQRYRQIVYVLSAFTSAGCQAVKTAYTFQPASVVTAIADDRQQPTIEAFAGRVDCSDSARVLTILPSGEHRSPRRLIKARRSIFSAPCSTTNSFANIYHAAAHHKALAVKQKHIGAAPKDGYPNAMDILRPYLIFFAALFSLPLLIGLLVGSTVTTLIGAIGLGCVAVLTIVVLIADHKK